MRLDLNEVVLKPGAVYNYEVNEAPGTVPEVELASAVTGNITFSNTGDCLLIRGRVNAELLLPCSRCLKPIVVSTIVAVDEAANVVYGGGHGGPTTAVITPMDEDDELLFDDNVFDLSELLRQLLLMEIPLQPLHSPDCKGICQKCGADLNDGPCGCKDSDDDAPLRWTDLAKLVHEDDEPSDDEDLNL